MRNVPSRRAKRANPDSYGTVDQWPRPQACRRRGVQQEVQRDLAYRRGRPRPEIRVRSVDMPVERLGLALCLGLEQQLQVVEIRAPQWPVRSVAPVLVEDGLGDIAKMVQSAVKDVTGIAHDLGSVGIGTSIPQ